jgi:uncharacterized protein YaiE (UPF0345 family)
MIGIAPVGQKTLLEMTINSHTASNLRGFTFKMKKYRISFSTAALALVLLISGCGRVENPLGLWKYEYRGYQSGRVLNAPALDAFTLPVKIENTYSLEFLAVGCAGSGNRGQKILGENMAAWAEKEETAFVLYLGDNFYPRGVKSVTDKQWKTKFEKIFDHKPLEIPFYAILGNHDYAENEQAQVEYTEHSKKWRMPARYYKFTEVLKGGTQIDFFAIDTEMLVQGWGEAQLSWLENQLGSSQARWKIVFGHRPLYTGDYRYNQKMDPIKNIVEPLLKKHKVDLYLSAHSHNIEVLKPVSGVHYIVSGAGSRPRNIIWGENTLFASAEIGFAAFRVSNAGIDVFLTGIKNEIEYAYTIKK